MLFILFCLCYLIGTFPSGILVAKSFGVNVTTQGSGNIGATNIARVLGKKAGLITLVLDMLKGIFGTSVPGIYAMLLAFEPSHKMYMYDATFLAAFATVLGHCLSLPGLKGGKGVATSLGVLLVIDPILALCSVGVFVIVFISTKIVSLASIACAVALPIVGYYILSPLIPAHLAMLSLISAIVAFRHKANIERLLRGEESRFSLGSR